MRTKSPILSDFSLTIKPKDESKSYFVLFHAVSAEGYLLKGHYLGSSLTAMKLVTRDYSGVLIISNK